MNKQMRANEIFKELNIPTDYNEEKIDLITLPLNLILNGGISKDGEVIQLVGESSTGRTTIALQIATAYCEQNMKVLYIDTCNSVTNDKLDIFKLSMHKNTNFFYCRENTFEKVEQILDKFIDTNEISLIVIDTIAGLINEGYLNISKKGISITNNNSNYDSRPLSLLIKKYSRLVNERKFSLLLVNDMRQKVHKKLGTMSKRYGPKILDYSCHSIIKIAQGSSTNFKKKFDNLKDGIVMDLEIVKSNHFKPTTKLPYYFKYITGISTIHSVIYYLMETKLIIQQGTYYELVGSGIKTNGLANFIEEFRPLYIAIYKSKRDEIYNYYKNTYIA